MQCLLLVLLCLAHFHQGHGVGTLNCECGIENNQQEILVARIVNGTTVRRYRYPWMAVLMDGIEQHCGGSIISEFNIITAAHCYTKNEKPLSWTRWITGVCSIDSAKRVYTDAHYATDVKYHPKYIRQWAYDIYDVAIVITTKPIIFNFFASPICLPSLNEEFNFANHIMTTIGYGFTSERGRSSDVLLETQVLLKSQEECEIALNPSGIEFDPKSMLCAYKKYTDACQGDSGGPLFTKKPNGHNVLLGIISFGKGCARGLPGIYTRLGLHDTLKWIYDVLEISKSNVCKNSMY